MPIATFPRLQSAGLAVMALLGAASAHAQMPNLARVQLTDGELTCAKAHAEIGTMDSVMALSPASAGQARARKEFLTQLFVAKGCKVSDLSFAGNPVSADAFRALVASGAGTSPPPMSAGAAGSPAPAPGAAPAVPPQPSAAELQAQLQAPVTPLDGSKHVQGEAKLKDKRFYISEYRVLFEIGGSVTASTRAAYFGGTDYGATRMTVNYQAPQVDINVLQAVTDRAYADFLSRMEAAGAKPEPMQPFVAQHGAIYESTQEGSKPGAAVTDEFDFGAGKRRYIIMAPTGTKLNARGLIGLGAGNIGTRSTWMHSNLEAISVVIAVNLAALESSGSGSSLFRRGSSANASAAMEIAAAPRTLLLQSHTHTNSVRFQGTLHVPGQFASMRETGGYDTRTDAAVQSVQQLGRMMGQAANQSKRVDMTIDVDNAAMAKLALQGLVSVNQALAATVK